jgi:hypothetical protein
VALVSAAGAFLPVRAATTAASGPTAAPYFGFSYPAGEASFATAAQAATGMTSLNSKPVLRLLINWAQIEGTCTNGQAIGSCFGSPVANWAILDADFSTLNAAGVRVLALISNAPKWSWNPTTCGGYCFESGEAAVPPADNNRGLYYLSSFTHAFMQRYDTQYPGEIVGVEVWNEENDSAINGWATNEDPPNPAYYTNVLCAAASGVHAVDPSTPVVLGGMTNVTTTNRTLSPTTFLSDVFSYNGGGCMNGVGIHIYPGYAVTTRTLLGTTTTFVGSNPSDVTYGFGPALSRVYATEQHYNYGTLPIWITEFGYCALDTKNGDSPLGCNGSPTVTNQGSISNLEVQAYYVECGYQLAQYYQSMYNVAGLFVYTLYDGATPTGIYGPYNNPYRDLGLFDYPGVQKYPGVLTPSFFSAVEAGTIPRLPQPSCADAYDWPAGMK